MLPQLRGGSAGRGRWWARPGTGTAAGRRGSRRGRAAAACRRSRSSRSWSRPRPGRTSRAARRSRPRVGLRLAEQPADHVQVLAAGDQLVDRRVLAGQADQAPHRVGLAHDVVAADRRPCPNPARAASPGSGWWSSCPRRSGRAARGWCPRSTARSTPSSARTSPKVLTRPSASIAAFAIAPPSSMPNTTSHRGRVHPTRLGSVREIIGIL